MSNLIREWSREQKLSYRASCSFKRYLLENINSFLFTDNFILDVQSLCTKINLSYCNECSKFTKFGCCSGNSYPMSADISERISNNFDSIIEYNKDFSTAGLHGVTKGLSTSTRGSVGGNCCFSYKGECCIKKWCDGTGRNQFVFLPERCSLYPIDAIRLPNNKIFVFCLSRHTKEFSMYSLDSIGRVCVDIDLAYKLVTSLPKGFMDNYREAYVEKENVLRYFIGDKVYNLFIAAVL